MPHSLPTSLAVSDALTHYRQLRELAVGELAQILLMLGHGLSVDDLLAIERRERPATVDDLVALAYALDTTPAVLLSHIPIDMPHPDGPLATALPSDVEQAELRAWLESRTTLDHPSRVAWAQEQVSRLRIRSAHHEEQLQGAYQELRDLGDLAIREADARPVIELHDRIMAGEHDLRDVDLALALAERRLDDLQGVQLWRRL